MLHPAITPGALFLGMLSFDLPIRAHLRPDQFRERLVPVFADFFLSGVIFSFFLLPLEPVPGGCLIGFRHPPPLIGSDLVAIGQSSA